MVDVGSLDSRGSFVESQIVLRGDGCDYTLPKLIMEAERINYECFPVTVAEMVVRSSGRVACKWWLEIDGVGSASRWTQIYEILSEKGLFFC